MKYRYETNDTITYHLLLQRAKEMRNNPTEAERTLWQHLNGNQMGAHFRRQHPVLDYIPDFVCLALKLIIEVDGDYHCTEEQRKKDEERSQWLATKGFTILRFSNDDIFSRLHFVLDKIRNKMKEISNMHSFDNKPASLSQASAPSLREGRGGFPVGRGGFPVDKHGLPGRLLVFSAPSGSGKSTIVQWLVKEHPELNLHFSVSCTSRLPRGTEQNGVEYFFISPEEFKKKIENKEFIEYEEVYKDRYYGTLKSQVEQQISRGENVVFDVDVKGGCNIKQCYGSRAMSIFVQPPSIEELRRRLNSRGTDTPEVIEQRLAKADYELSFARKFDHIVVNDDLETAKQKTYELLSTFLNQR